MKMQRIVKPEQHIVSIQKRIAVTEIPTLIAPAIMKLEAYVEKQGGELLGTPFVSYKNMNQDGSVDLGNIEIEVGYPVNKAIPATEEIFSYLQPSYPAMQTLYVGSYDDMTEPYMAMLEEIKQEGKAFLGISYEYYLSEETVPVEEHETIIEIPYR